MLNNIFQVKGSLKKLDTDQQTLNALWKEKERWLKELLNLQLLNTEAERIDAATKGHEAFLELSNLGVFFHILKVFGTNIIDFDIESLRLQYNSFDNSVLFLQFSIILLYNKI